ncbi:MAG: hypothetical protein WD668_10690, partial [Saccharospirillum sp.]
GDQAATASPGTIQQLGTTDMVIACGQGTLLIERLQMPGKKAMATADVLNARRAAFEADPVFSSNQLHQTEAAQ